MTEFEFVEDLPAGNRRRDPVINEFAAALKERPGQWAKWPISIGFNTANGTAHRIRHGQHAGFKDGLYDACHTEGVLYVRFVGEL